MIESIENLVGMRNVISSERFFWARVSSTASTSQLSFREPKLFENSKDQQLYIALYSSLIPTPSVLVPMYVLLNITKCKLTLSKKLKLRPYLLGKSLQGPNKPIILLPTKPNTSHKQGYFYIWKLKYLH